MKKYEVCIIEYDTMDVVRKRTVASLSEAEKQDSAYKKNLNHDKYFTEIRIRGNHDRSE